MGAAAATLSLGEAIGILQSWHSYNRDETWSRRGYDIGLQSMRIDILNTVREEMRDQVTVIISSLDNLMVVATLMLSIGFGFVVEGTFPPAETDYDYDDTQKVFLVAYAVLAALALVFPLFTLMLTIAARFEVELCQQDVMGDLQKHLLKALRRDRLDALETKAASPRSDEAAPGRHISSPSSSSWSQQPSRVLRGRSAPALGRTTPVFGRKLTPPCKDFGKALRGGLQKQFGNFYTFFYEDTVGRIAEDEVKLIAEGLLQKVNHYHFLYPIAQLFLWLGMLSSVMVCCVLLGLYYQANYPNTPAMWRCYTFILVVCVIGSVIFLLWMKYHMLRDKQEEVRTKTSASSVFHEESAAPVDSAVPVFDSDEQVEAAYRRAFHTPTDGAGDLEAFETAAEDSDSGSAPRRPALPTQPRTGQRPRRISEARSDVSSAPSLPGFPYG